MSDDILTQVKTVISSCIGGEYQNQKLTDDLKLIGNVLDSMAVTNLIVALEEQFGIIMEDQDLTAETFETVASLADLVRRKTAG